MKRKLTRLASTTALVVGIFGLWLTMSGLSFDGITFGQALPFIILFIIALAWSTWYINRNFVDGEWR